MCPVDAVAVGLDMVRVTVGGDDESDGGATAICAGEADSKLMTVVGFVLAREFWRDGMSPSSEVYDAPMDEPIVSLRPPVIGGGDVVRTRLGAESHLHRGAEPDRDLAEIEVGEGGIGRTLASSSATRPAGGNDKDWLMPLASSAMEMRGPRVARSDRDAIDGVREREKTLIEGGRDPESMVDAGYDRRKSGTGMEG